MRYCVLGDIHGNLEALEACLTDADRQGADRYLCAGDIVGYGASPSECVARVRDLTSHVVAGNHDYAAIGRADIEYFNLYAREAILWTRRALSEDDKTYLTSLPLKLNVSGFVLVHATVHEPGQFGYIESALAARDSFQAMRTTSLAFVAHSHVPVTFFCEKDINDIWYSQDVDLALGDFEKAIVNVGSVGQPRDDNPDACYVLYDGEQHAITLRRVPYDVEKSREKIISSGLPEVLAARLLIGR
ncbi:metallophosphoesterase family protein [bacterium]|nr:metallophosphoesterase family protein [bacterium]